MEIEPKKAIQSPPRLRPKKRLGGRIPKFEKNVKFLWKCSRTPVYVSRGRREFIIYQDGLTWRIRAWHGGFLSPKLKGTFTSFKTAETVLIGFLKRTDKFQTAVYPGCRPEAREALLQHIERYETYAPSIRQQALSDVRKRPHNRG